ncbi:hypothetical protein PO124_22845 [Bacillus licheniformis]|nr:hypothetical protein [Bacillus licheniformis]
MPSFSSIRGGEEYYGYYLASMSCGLLLGSIFATVFGRFAIGSLTIYGFSFQGFYGVFRRSPPLHTYRLFIWFVSNIHRRDKRHFMSICKAYCRKSL